MGTNRFIQQQQRKRAKFEAKYPALSLRMKRKRSHDRKLLSEHGMSPADYDYVLRVQQGRCAICRRRPEDTGQVYLAVDHCHQTHRTRGLLCRGCNWTLGVVREDPLVAKALLDSIENRCQPAKMIGGG